MKQSLTMAADGCTQRALLNCYVREVAPLGSVRVKRLESASALEEPLRDQWRAPLHLLTVRLEASRSWLLTLIDPPSLVQNYQHRSAIYVFTEEEPLVEATPERLFALLTESMASLLGVAANPELALLYQDSIRVSRIIQSKAHARNEDLPRAPWEVFLRSEQGLVDGHRFHPSPKSRRGFSDEDVERFSPERQVRHRLHHFAVRPELVSGGSTLKDSFGDVLNQLPLRSAPVPAGWLRVPVHPWQATCLKQMPEVCAALSSGALLDLGPGDDWVYPTSSVRTVFHPELPFFLKLSLNVRITNCLRRQHPRELASAMHVSKVWKDAECPYPSFKVLEEPVFASVHLGNHAHVAEAFSLILRENPLAEPKVGSDRLREAPVLAATLFGADPTWRNEVLPSDAVTWFQGYVRTLLPPLLHAFFERGVMFEAHLQNVLVANNAQGRGVRIFVRDLDNAKLLFDGAPPTAFDGLSPELTEEVGYFLKDAWPRFVYCLFVNHLAEGIAACVGGHREHELAIWATIQMVLSDYLRQTRSARAAEYLTPLLAGEDLPAKTNLLTRYRKTKDRDAGYRPVPNPLRYLTLG